MTNANTTANCDGALEGLARSGAGRDVRFSPVGTLADGSRPLAEHVPFSAVSARKQFDNLAVEVSRMMPLWPDELYTSSPNERELLLARIQRALEGDSQRGKINHWAYDYARHSALLSTFKKMKEVARHVE